MEHGEIDGDLDRRKGLGRNIRKSSKWIRVKRTTGKKNKWKGEGEVSNSMGGEKGIVEEQYGGDKRGEMMLIMIQKGRWESGR